MTDEAGLKNLYIRSKGVAEGFMLGLHRSPYHGFSTEFSQHRPYQFGDEIRHIDWTLYGRTDRYYIRQFEEETNLSAMICVDNSASMAYRSRNLSKYEYASLLASALTYLLIRQNDAVGLCLFNEKIEEFLAPKALKSRHRLVSDILSSSTAASGTDITVTLHSIAEKMRKRGLIILISDLWDDRDEILKGLLHLKFQKQELIVFHVHDPLELSFDMEEKAAFRDMENGRILKIDTRHISEEYREKVQQRIEWFRRQLGEADIDHVLLNSSEEMTRALQEYLIKRSRLN